MTTMTNIHSSRGNVPDAVRRGRGFSLIEIMVTVTLLAVIILGTGDDVQSRPSGLSPRA